VSSFILVSFLCICYSAGHFYYTCFLIWATFQMYFEMLKLFLNYKKPPNMISQFLDYLFPCLFCFYLAPKTFIRRVLIDNDTMYNFREDTPILYSILFVHHTFICGMLLLISLVLFTLSLEKGQYKYQFKKLGW